MSVAPGRSTRGAVPVVRTSVWGPPAWDVELVRLGTDGKVDIPDVPFPSRREREGDAACDEAADFADPSSPVHVGDSLPENAIPRDLFEAPHEFLDPQSPRKVPISAAFAADLKRDALRDPACKVWNGPTQTSVWDSTYSQQPVEASWGQESYGNWQESWITPGAAVCFHGLQIATELNGECGIVKWWDEASSRWVVRMNSSGEEKYAKSENLLLVLPPGMVAYPDLSYWGGQVVEPGPSQARRAREQRAPRTAPEAPKGSAGTPSFGSDSTAVYSARSSLSSEGGISSTVPMTTVMMRNIPNDYTGSMLLELLNKRGFKGFYDLLYLPMDYHNHVGFGYAFINFISPEEAERFRQVFIGFQEWDINSGKVCEVCWSNVLQGVQAHIDRYRNSPVMHEAVPDDFKPMLFRNGERVPFPGPTKTIRPPRLRKKEGKTAVSPRATM